MEGQSAIRKKNSVQRLEEKNDQGVTILDDVRENDKEDFSKQHALYIK